MKQLLKAMTIFVAVGLLSITPPAVAQQPKDNPKSAKTPQTSPGTTDQPKAAVTADSKQKTGTAKTGNERKTTTMRSGGGPAASSAAIQDEDLFELHIRVRRTARGIDVLLAGTTPSAQGAAEAADLISQVREYGMVGFVVVPLMVKSNPNTSRALQSAWGSIKADASGPKLTLSASIPHEAVAAVTEVVDAAVAYVMGR